jgi:branched-chain amino acid transport system substrate-binding protein
MKIRKTLFDRLLALRSRKAITRIQAAILVAVIILAAISGFFYFYLTATQTQEIIIGAPLPLSGSMATIGLSCQRGHDLAVEDINAAGGIKSLGGRRIKIVYGDTQSNPTVATSETERLIATYNPTALIGAYSSALTLVATEVSERHKVPFLAPMAQVDSLTDRGFQYIFRQAIRSSNTGAKAVDMIVDMAQHFGTPVTNVAFVYDNSLLGQTISNSSKTRALEANFTIVFDEMFTANAQDLSPLVIRLKAANPKPDVIFILAYLNDAILLANTFQEFQMNAKAFVGMAGAGFLEPSFITSAGNNSEYFFAGTGWTRDLNIPGLADVVTRFEQKYPQFMNEHAGLCYAATWLMKEALEMSGSLHPDKPLDPDSIRDAFLKIDISSGPAAMTAMGRAKFNEKGDNIYGTQIYLQILNGTQHTVWPFNVASTNAVFPTPPWSER